MPPIRSLAFICCVLLAASISLNGKIMSPCSCYAKKGLVCVAITAPSSRQLSSCLECTKANTYFSCNVHLVSNNKCIFMLFSDIHNLFQLLGGNT